jgi:flagella basal body P-ring formation protein FlgA
VGLLLARTVWAEPAPEGPLLPAQAVAEAVALAATAAAALAPVPARVEVLPGALDPRLKLAPCAKVQASLAAGVPSWGRSRVALQCVDGATRWKVFLPVTVQVWAPAMVTAVALPAGARLEESQLATRVIDWGAAAEPAWTRAEALAGRVLVRPLAAGQPVRAADLQARQWFARGDAVTLLAAGPGFAVTAAAQAQTAGIEGHAASAVTAAGVVVVGRPVGDHRMEVGP